MKRLKITRFVTLFIALCLSLSAAASQAPQSPAKQQTGKIMGTLLDINGSRVAHAKVKVESAKFKWEGESDEAGDFTVELPAGEYRILVQAPGFRYFESAFLRVKPNVTEMINIHLEVAAMPHPVPVQNR
jgi:uncharacterized membrane protein